jgi:hypothetical protein
MNKNSLITDNQLILLLATINLLSSNFRNKQLHLVHKTTIDDDSFVDDFSLEFPATRWTLGALVIFWFVFFEKFKTEIV